MSVPSTSAARAAPKSRDAAIAGLLAAATALLVLLAGAALTGQPGFLEVVANGVTAYVPLAVFDTILTALGPYAKGVLFTGVCAVTLLAGAGAAALLARFGGLGRDRPEAEPLYVGAIAALLAEAVVLPVFGGGFFGTGLVSPPLPLHLPLALAALGYGLTLSGLVRGWERAPSGPSPRAPAAPPGEDSQAEGGVEADATGAPIARRTFLGRALVLLGLGSLAVSGGAVVTRVAAGAARDRLGLPKPADLGGFGPTPSATPVSDFYVVAKDLLATQVDRASWRLKVDGLVDRPRQYTLDELRAMPFVEGYRTLQCISNEVVTYGSLIGNQRWQGLRLSTLLDAVGARPTATFVLWRCADGYTESTPIAVAQAETTWLVYEMGPPGTLLNADHGAPLRVLIAGRYGMKQPKYVTEIELADHDEAGYWEQRGWDEQAIVRTYSRIDFPLGGQDGQVLVGTAFTAFGVASAGDRGISKVELSPDGGSTWRVAELEPLGGPISTITWRRWRVPDISFDTPGGHTLEVRATDGTGALQDPVERPSLPSGATGYDRVTLTALPAPASPASPAAS